MNTEHDSRNPRDPQCGAFVTGGTGFVGAAVVRALLAEGVSVTCLVREGSDLANLRGLPVQLVQGDLTDESSLRKGMSDCQTLYHVAALYSTHPEAASEMYRANVDGTRYVLGVARELGVQRMVHTSTIGAIGRPRDGSLPTEMDVFDDWDTASPYARSKIEGERIALQMAQEGAPVVVVNPCAPVGARDLKPSSTGQRIIDYLCGKPPSFLDGGINFVSVRDVAQGHLLAAQKGRLGERYILGNASGNLDLAAFLALMAQVSGNSLGTPQRSFLRRLAQKAKRMLRGGTAPAGEQPVGFRPTALTADPSKAIRELGLPQTPLEDAFAEAVAWFRAHGYVREEG